MRQTNYACSDRGSAVLKVQHQAARRKPSPKLSWTTCPLQGTCLAKKNLPLETLFPPGLVGIQVALLLNSAHCRAHATIRCSNAARLPAARSGRPSATSLRPARERALWLVAFEVEREAFCWPQQMRKKKEEQRRRLRARLALKVRLRIFQPRAKVKLRLSQPSSWRKPVHQRGLPKKGGGPFFLGFWRAFPWKTNQPKKHGASSSICCVNPKKLML